MPKDTSKATEARVAKAAQAKEDRDAEAARERSIASIKKRYGEFLPDNTIDPLGVYKLWKQAIFGDLPDDIKADDTIMYFVVSQAKAAGIDCRVPNQIYAIPYKNYKLKTIKWTTIIGIQGMVTIAERTGMYGGCTKPEYEFGINPDGTIDYNKIISCTVGVNKVTQGIVTTSYATAYFDEYDTKENLWKAVDATKEKDIWKNNQRTGETKTVPDGGKPKTMIAKVARAQAIRATFSACAGLYIAEEMERPDYIEGELVTPDLAADIKAAPDAVAIKEIMAGLSVEDKKRVAPLIAERLKEL